MGHHGAGVYYSEFSRRCRSAASVRAVVCAGMASVTLMTGVGLVPTQAFAGSCTNEALRTGPSASLPDCRAYELVTPADKGGAQDIFTFQSVDDQAIPAPDGERIALQAVFAKYGPNPGSGGGNAHNTYIFSRNSELGWQMASIYPEGSGQTGYSAEIFSPDLAQVGVRASTARTAYVLGSEHSFAVGPPGGPYATVATTPNVEGEQAETLYGGSSDLSDVVLVSSDHALLPEAAGTNGGAFDLYEWSGGGECGAVTSNCKLVNVTNAGTLVSACGAMLGGGFQQGAHNAVSEDGSKIFFTSPENGNCGTAPSLYMRLEGRETVEVSVPVGVVLSRAEEEMPVFYRGAAADGSKVFFTTKRALTAGAVKGEFGLYEYNTVTRVLTLISQVDTFEGEVRGVTVSEDGSTVYFTQNGVVVYRYDTESKETHGVATAVDGIEGTGSELPYATPNGRFFLFVSHGGVVGEPRGEGHTEIYRYDSEDGSVMCVSCGPGKKAPAEGNASLPTIFAQSVLPSPDLTPGLIPMSKDGRYVFFDSTARLVPRDTNSTAESGLGTYPGQDVYEWEADGIGGCELSQGCTYLISSGESGIESTLLGASENGRDVFFATHARLVPQDTDSYGDIYDARTGGGFPAPPPPPPVCSSCQGVGSPPPLFSVPASLSFVGPGNPSITVAHKPKAKRKPKRHARHRGKSKAARRRGDTVLSSEGRRR
jgi:hypothetical protein